MRHSFLYEVLYPNSIMTLVSEIWKPLNFCMPKILLKKYMHETLNFGMPLKFCWKNIWTLVSEIWKPLNFGMPLKFCFKNIGTL